jgi:hypothetical protein
MAFEPHMDDAAYFDHYFCSFIAKTNIFCYYCDSDLILPAMIDLQSSPGERASMSAVSAPFLERAPQGLRIAGGAR